MEIIEKVYYCENTDVLEERIALLDRPEFCLGCVRELIEMNFSQITVKCLPWQISGVESVLAPCM